jgi:hypothetical protein
MTSMKLLISSMEGSSTCNEYLSHPYATKSKSFVTSVIVVFSVARKGFKPITSESSS